MSTKREAIPTGSLDFWQGPLRSHVHTMPMTCGGLPRAPAHIRGLSTKSGQVHTTPSIQPAHAIRKPVHLEVGPYPQQPRHLDGRSQLWWCSVDALRRGDPAPMCHKKHILEDNVGHAMLFRGWESQSWVLFTCLYLKAEWINDICMTLAWDSPWGCAANRHTWLYLLGLCCWPGSLSLAPPGPLLS